MTDKGKIVALTATNVERKECWDKCRNYCLIERMIAAGYEEEKVVKEETMRELFSAFRMYIENRFGANVGVDE